MTAAVQTLWCELLASTLADAGVATVVISPGSRSTPIVAALVGEPRCSLVTIIDERAAAFYALGVARATGLPAALVCTSGTAAAHYLPAIIEASLAGVPMIAITADRPPELQACGASQTIDQIDLYGGFVRGAFDLGAPAGSQLALRAVRRTLVQAITLSRGPRPGPVHLEVPLRKPLEPAAPSTDEELALAALVGVLQRPVDIAPPRLAADTTAITDLAAAIAAEPDGIIVAGALPVGFAAGDADDALFASERAAMPPGVEMLLALAARAGYPVLAEAGSQVRGPSRGTATLVDHVDLIPIAHRPAPRLVIQLGAEPVAASWPAWDLAGATRYVLAESWADPTSSAQVVLGHVATSLSALLEKLATDRSAPIATFVSDATRRPSQQRIRTSAWLDTWRDLDARAGSCLDRALADHPRSESAVVRAAIEALPDDAMVQIGNSLPIRVIDQVAAPRASVITQRGAAGIDGLIASAAGATRSGHPVLLVLGDVSFAHDIGGLLAARCASAPLAILVIDNGGGQIFAGLPLAKTGVELETHWLTPPELDPAAVALALGANARTAASPAAVASAIAEALAAPGVTVIHAPVTPSGAHDVRRSALELFAMEDSHDHAQSPRSPRLVNRPHVDAS